MDIWTTLVHILEVAMGVVIAQLILLTIEGFFNE